MENRVSLLQIFGVFAKIGAFTIGGGYAMSPLIQAELGRRGWISEEELPDIVAISQSAPGVMAVNISIFAGHRLRGVKGSIAATLGSILPSFVIILAIAMFFTAFKDNPWVERAFKGIRPVVISLIAVPMINMAKKSCKNWWTWGLAVTALVLVSFLNVSPIYIILCVLVVGFSVTYYGMKEIPGQAGNDGGQAGNDKMKEGR
ncbi:MAG: chromate transporter [Bacteroidales bacterium]|nr:chromate transporter [Bacteroidales bacterium]